MIDDEAKRKLLKELEKIGIISPACAAIGINRSTFYRWKKEDKKFRKQADTAERIGRANVGDICEYSLIRLIKEGKLEAIKYYASHNLPRYKPKRTDSFTIKHESIGKIPLLPQHTLEDMLNADERKLNEET